MRTDPTVMLPFRAIAVASDATANGTVALPCPLESAPIVSHPTSALVVQPQSRSVLIVIVPLPPADPKADGELVAVTPHFAALGLERRDVDADEQPATSAAHHTTAANRKDTERG